MSGRTSPHFGFRVTDSMVPQVEVTNHGRVVHRVYGVTHGHAITRALKWMHSHGDPR